MIDVQYRAPSADLAPYIRGHYLFEAALPSGFAVADSLYTDNGFVRVILDGQIEAVAADGGQQPLSGPYLLGSNLHGFPIRLSGSFRAVGFAIRPCAWRALFNADPRALVDTIQPLADIWGDAAARLHEAVAQAKDTDSSIVAMETAIRAQLASMKHKRIDQQIARFEQIMRTNSTARVDDVAAQLGLSARQFERRCLASFGITPKTILRRSRFLDMAAATKGFSAPEDQELIGLRYFDQSHRNREFRKFVGMTPGQFAKADLPLVALSLSMREQGKAIS